LDFSLLSPTFEDFWSGGKTKSILDHSSLLEAFGPPKIVFSYRVSEDKFPSLFQYLFIMLYLDFYL